MRGVIAFLLAFLLAFAPVTGVGADPLTSIGVAKNVSVPNMSVPNKESLGVPRCGSVPMVVAGFSRGDKLAQNDVGEWCSEDRYCKTGSFCCAGGCCANGSNCCEQDPGCCPGNKPIGCGPKCYRNQAEAEADGCTNWEVCGAPVR